MHSTYRHLLLIAGTGVLIYFNVLGHQFNLDDAYILSQLPPADSGLSDVFSVFKNFYGHADYRPVTVFSFALEQWIFSGIQLPVAHGINVLLFVLAAGCLYLTLRMLPVKDSTTIALIATLLFLAHPVHSGVVCSIKNRDNLLSFLFGIMAWYFSLKSVTGQRPVYIIPAILLLTTGLFAKLDALTFLLLIPLSLWVFYPEKRKPAIIISACLVLALGARAAAAVYFVPAPNSVTFTENPVILQWDLWHRIAQSMQTLAYYLKFMFVPDGYWFYFGYDMIPLKPFISIHTFIFFLLHLVALALVVYLWRKARAVSFGILFFYLSLAYCANLAVPVAGILADRYAFIASAGFSLALAGILYFFFGSSDTGQATKVKSKKKNVTFTNKKLYLATGAICMIWSGFTIARNLDWKDTDTLLQADMPHLVNSFEANRIAASVYFKAGVEKSTDAVSAQANIGKGLSYALQAQKVYDKNLYIEESVGQAYFNTGQTDLAIQQFRKNLSRFDTSRLSNEVLGDIFYLKGLPDSAAKYYQHTMAIAPKYDAAYFKYLRALNKANKLSDAETFANQLLKQNPDWYLPYQCLSYVLLEKMDSLRGLEYYARSFAKGYRNDEAAREISGKLLRMGDTSGANALLRQIQP